MKTRSWFKQLQLKNQKKKEAQAKFKAIAVANEKSAVENKKD